MSISEEAPESGFSIAGCQTFKVTDDEQCARCCLEADTEDELRAKLKHLIICTL